ncbi:Acetolactate synthase, partial [Aduncisulcus paluster]
PASAAGPTPAAAPESNTVAPQRVTGAQSVVRSLEELGVEVIFGIPGGAVLPVYDPLYDSVKVRHVLVRHEQGAGHAASGYAHANGKVGVMMATSGPGATNLVTPLADAQMDSIPVVAITGQVGRGLIGTDAFQEADISGITMPITKHNFLVNNAEDIPRVIAEAFYIASSGRPGAVLVDIPKDVLQSQTTFSWPPQIYLPGYKPVTKPHGKQLHMGMPGMHGTVGAVAALQRSDLLITLGARFDDRVTGQLDSFAPEAKVIHADIDPAEIGKNRHADVPIVGDVKNVISELIEAIRADRAAGTVADPLSEWWEYLGGIRSTYPLGYDAQHDGSLGPEFVIETLGKIAGPDAVYVAGVGQHQMWAAQFIKYENPRTWLNSG